MKKHFAVLLILVLVLGIFSGCGKTSNSVSSPMQYAASDTYSMKEELAYDSYDMGAGLTRGSGSESTGAISLPQNRKWVITMNLSAETDDLDAALSAVSNQITGMGGYVESQSISNSSSYQRKRYASLTIRVPAELADSFVQEVSGITNVVSNSRYVQDITLSYTDTEGRITALTTEQTRLLELMEQADNMSDLLEIEARLTEVRYQLENYSSTLRLYDNQVDYATISLYISEVVKFTPVEEPGFFQKIKDGLSDSIIDLGQSLVEFVEWIIIDLPYLILWCLVIWGGIAIVKRFIRKKKAKKQSANQNKSEKSEK